MNKPLTDKERWPMGRPTLIDDMLDEARLAIEKGEATQEQIDKVEIADDGPNRREAMQRLLARNS